MSFHYLALDYLPILYSLFENDVFTAEMIDDKEITPQLKYLEKWGYLRCCGILAKNKRHYKMYKIKSHYADLLKRGEFTHEKSD